MMISIFSIKNFCILLIIINRISADQCVKKNSCECYFESGYGYDLHQLDKTENFEANGSSSGAEYIFHPCTDSTILPPKNASLNECNTGFAVIELYNNDRLKLF